MSTMKRDLTAAITALLAALACSAAAAAGPATGPQDDRQARCADIKIALQSFRDDAAELDTQIKEATTAPLRDSLMRRKQYVANQFGEKMGEYQKAGCDTATAPDKPTPAPGDSPSTGGSPGAPRPAADGRPAPPVLMAQLKGACTGAISVNPVSGATSKPVRILVTVMKGAEDVRDVVIDNTTCKRCEARFAGEGQYYLDAYFGPWENPGITSTQPAAQPFAQSTDAGKNADGSLAGSVTSSLLPQSLGKNIVVNVTVNGAGGTELCRGAVELGLKPPAGARP